MRIENHEVTIRKMKVDILTLLLLLCSSFQHMYRKKSPIRHWEKGIRADRKKATLDLTKRLLNICDAALYPPNSLKG